MAAIAHLWPPDLAGLHIGVVTHWIWQNYCNLLAYNQISSITLRYLLITHDHVIANHKVAQGRTWSLKFAQGRSTSLKGAQGL